MKNKQENPSVEKIAITILMIAILYFWLKHRPDISDPEDIHIIVVDIIDKKIPRMSVKKLNEILDDLGYEVKGSGVHLDDSDTSSDYE